MESRSVKEVDALSGSGIITNSSRGITNNNSLVMPLDGIASSSSSTGSHVRVIIDESELLTDEGDLSEGGWRTIDTAAVSEGVSASPDSKSDVSADDGDKKKDDKWYPGKYLKKLRKKKEDEASDEIKSKVEDDEKNAKEEVEEKKQDSMICTVVRNIRERFLKRQLIGRIYIYRISGIISTAVTSDVVADDIADYLIQHAADTDFFESDPMMQAELTGNYKRALSMTDTILNSLERRSLSYSTAEYAHTTLLTRGTTVGVSDPFIGIVNFSFTLELSATAASLLASRRRFEAARDIALSVRPDINPTPLERLSSFKQSLSFSFFSKKDKDSSENNNNSSSNSNNDNEGGANRNSNSNNCNAPTDLKPSSTANDKFSDSEDEEEEGEGNNGKLDSMDPSFIDSLNKK